MRTKNKHYILISLLLSLCVHLYSQSSYIPTDSVAIDQLSFTFSGGLLQSYGCNGQDPTYWMSGNGDQILIEFVQPQANPSIRVWGINDDDVAQFYVNNASYPLTETSASYDEKVICSTVYDSPGPDGVLFTSGFLVGANTNTEGNYSYQNITLFTTGIHSITIAGKSGASWGVVGVTLGSATSASFTKADASHFQLYPNPTSGKLFFKMDEVVPYVELEIVSMLGATLFKKTFIEASTVEMDISKEKSGVYFLRFKSAKFNYTRKFVLK